MIRKVGTPKSKGKLWQYGDCEKDYDGWVDATTWLPEDFDLLDLKTDITKTVKGWWTGHNWDGYRLPEKAKVHYWKRNEEAFHANV